MPRYVEGTDIKLTTRDRIFVDAEFFGGDKVEGLLPRRLFPISGPSRYIALTDNEGDAVCIIRNVDNLLPDAKKVLEDALDLHYMIPKISKVLKWVSEQGQHIWTVETDRGQADIVITDNTNQIKRLFNDRVLIKDSSDNRYEIPDFNKLDVRSQNLIMPDV